MNKLRLASLLTALLTLTGCVGPFEFLGKLEKKSKKFYYLEVEHRVLKEKYEKLKKEHYHLEHEVQHLRAALETYKQVEQNRQLAGKKSGKRLSVIDFKIPKKLSIAQKQQLAHELFQKKEYDKAAKVFETFLYSPEGERFHTPESFFFAGVTWYKLENFARARENFMSARLRAKGLDGHELVQRIDLWMKVMDKQGAHGWSREVSSSH